MEVYTGLATNIGRAKHASIMSTGFLPAESRAAGVVRVCFVQKQAFAYFGVMSLSGYVTKDQTVETDVLVGNLEQDLIESVTELNPDFLAFSVLTSEHPWLKEKCREMKRAFPDLPILVGGVHAMLYPDEILKIPEVDVVCTGEGEETLARLCKTFENGQFSNLDESRGVAFRREGQIVVNDREDFLQELNNHFEDREIYHKRYPGMQKDDLKQFYASRGCPYKCSFCFNEDVVSKLERY